MLTLSPVWHGRLRAARRVQNFLLQTLVIHPALLFFLLFLLGAHSAGGAGQWLVSGAERLVRDAPMGQVWGCASQASRSENWPSVPDASLHKPAMVSGDFKPAPPAAMCLKAAVSHEAWAAETNSRLLFLYKGGVVLSVISGWVMGRFRRRVEGENV
ncbi:MAG: hypothetical protein ACJ8LD_16730 [Pantoea agglomerans]